MPSKGNPRSTTTKPKPGGKRDRRLAENRSAAYKSGDRTKKAGKPTNARDGGSRARID